MRSSTDWLALYNDTKEWKYWYNYCVMDRHEKVIIEKAVATYNTAELNLIIAKGVLEDALYDLNSIYPDIIGD